MPSSFTFYIYDPRRDIHEPIRRLAFSTEAIALDDYIKKEIPDNTANVLKIEDTHSDITSFYFYTKVNNSVAITLEKITEERYWEVLKTQGIIKPPEIFTFTDYLKRQFKFENGEEGVKIFINNELKLVLPETECVEIIEGLLKICNFPITQKIFNAKKLSYL